MATPKTVQLYFYKDGDGDRMVTNRMPVHRNGGLYASNDDAVVNMEICDEGRAIFGIEDEVGDNKIVRVTLAVEAVEVGEYEVKAEFKPFAHVAARRRARS